MLTMTNRTSHDNMHSPLNLAHRYLSGSPLPRPRSTVTGFQRIITKVMELSTQINLAGS
jgi:hypothetical protein